MISSSFIARQGSRARLLAIAACMCFALAGCDQSADAPQVTGKPAADPSPAPPVASRSAEDRVVVFLGDSLFAGYGLAPQDALPAQIEAIWRARGLDATVINAGVSGDTTANALARFDWSVAAAEPDLVVLALGANDFLLGVPADIMRGNLAAIIAAAQAEKIDVVLVGIAPRGSPVAGSREADFAAVYPELAEEFGLAYYPSLLGPVEADPALLQADGLHPTKEGVARIGAPLSQFLKPLVQVIED
jgi:acyl-CoA thioesterase I